MSEFLEWLDANMDPRFKIFVGPCAHGRDPYTRCEDGCAEISPELAKDKAQLAEAVEVLKGYERWEAQLVESNPAWGPGGLPRFTQELYESWMELQAKRNAVLRPSTP